MGWTRSWLDQNRRLCLAWGLAELTPCSYTHLLWKNLKHRKIKLVLQGSYSDWCLCFSCSLFSSCPSKHLCLVLISSSSWHWGPSRVIRRKCLFVTVIASPFVQRGWVWTPWSAGEVMEQGWYFPAGFRAKEEQQAVCQPWPESSTGWRPSAGISNQRTAGTSSVVSWARRDLVISVETSEACWKFYQVCLSLWFGHQNVISGEPEDLLIYVKSHSELPVKYHLHTDSSKLNKGWRVQKGSKTVTFFFQEMFYLTGRKMYSAKIKGSLQHSSFQLLLKCVFESWEPCGQQEAGMSWKEENGFALQRTMLGPH